MSRIAVTSKMKFFMIIVKVYQPLSFVIKGVILDAACSMWQHAVPKTVRLFDANNPAIHDVN